MPLSISSNILFTQQQYLFYDTCDSGNEKINLMSGIFSFFIGIHHIPTFLENGMNDGDLKLGYIAEHVWKDFEISPLLLNIGGFSFSFESEIIKVFPFPQPSWALK